MSFRFAKNFLLRLPLFPSSVYQPELEGVLKDPLFQAAVYLASPLFYKRLADVNFESGKLSAKEALSRIALDSPTMNALAARKSIQ